MGQRGVARISHGPFPPRPDGPAYRGRDAPPSTSLLTAISAAMLGKLTPRRELKENIVMSNLARSVLELHASESR